MKCPNCKEESHPNGAKYCHKCGAALGRKPTSGNKIKDSFILKIILLIVTSILFIGISIYEGYNIGGTTAIVVIIGNAILLGGILENFQCEYGMYIFIPTTISVVSFCFLARFLPNIWGIIIGSVLLLITGSIAKAIEDYEM